MECILVSRSEEPIISEIKLPASKSESNRALIIQALAQYQSGTRIELQNLSEARDTQTLQRLLASVQQDLDVLDAGTTMRFLTAYLSITQQDKVLTGSARMQERPIGILVEALREIGFQIDYVNQQGFPPLRIQGQATFEQQKKHVKIRGDVSSQFISALLMIAPLLPQGLTLELTGKIGSKPYIQMTLSQMQQFGIRHQWRENLIEIAPQTYQAGHYQVESDWSAASYWYSIVSLAKNAQVKLLGLRPESLQGDSVITEIMTQLGVRSTFLPEGVLLEKKPIQLHEALQLDFTACPDLAQTVVALCAVKKIDLLCKGLESLRIKETDRIKALQKEIRKFGCELQEDYGYWCLLFEQWAEVSASRLNQKSPITISTYEDHRMAMAFAPIALLHPLKMKDPMVVKKSYPHFWEDLVLAGFKISKAG